MGTGTRVSTSCYIACRCLFLQRLWKALEETLDCFLRSPSLFCTIHETPTFSGLSSQSIPRFSIPHLREVLGELGDDVLDLGLKLLAEGTLGLKVVEVTVDTSEDEGNHLVDGHGLVLLLLEELGE